MLRVKALLVLGVVACIGCSTSGKGHPLDPVSRDSGNHPMFNRDAFVDVYKRSVLPSSVARQAEIDDLARSSEVDFVRLFLDDRTFAIVTPEGPGLRGANGNGAILLYQWNDGNWCFVQRFGGYDCRVQPDLKAPAIVSLERISTDIVRRKIERWNGARFEIVTSERIPYPGE